MNSLLAIDVGLRTGFALYGADGRLCWYRSHYYGSMDRFKREVSGMLDGIADLKWLVVDGSGDTVDIWVEEAKRRGIITMIVPAESWREKVMFLRERRPCVQTKKHAEGIARQIVAWSAISSRPTFLKHETAEAILIGLWGVLEVGILSEMPPALHRF